MTHRNNFSFIAMNVYNELYIRSSQYTVHQIGLRLVNEKSFRKNIFNVLADNKLNSSQRMPINTFRYASMGGQGCLSSIGNE